jgi:hypothetical protein
MSKRPSWTEPQADLRALFPRLVFGEAGERDDAAVRWAEPLALVRRLHIADVGDAAVDRAPLQDELWTACPSA